MKIDDNIRINSAREELDKILQKYDLGVGFKFDFPKYQTLPDEVKLAVSILIKHGLRIQFLLKAK
jgi:hypothetical protein